MQSRKRHVQFRWLPFTLLITFTTSIKLLILWSRQLISFTTKSEMYQPEVQRLEWYPGSASNMTLSFQLQKFMTLQYFAFITSCDTGTTSKSICTMESSRHYMGQMTVNLTTTQLRLLLFFFFIISINLKDNLEIGVLRCKLRSDRNYRYKTSCINYTRKSSLYLLNILSVKKPMDKIIFI